MRDAKSLWEYCQPIWEMPVASVRIKDLRNVVENAEAERKEGQRQASDRTKTRIKSMFNLMYDYAIEYEIVDRNYAREFALSKIITENIVDPDTEHLAFTDEEVKSLWQKPHNKTIREILIQLYGGWRPVELLELRLENINLDNMTIKGGMKTPSGEYRIVPIHHLINDLVLEQISIAKEKGSPWLFQTRKILKNTRHIFNTETRSIML